MATLKSKSNIHAVVLCGGSGTRLWPLSRNAFPKQFLSLDGSQNSLLQASLRRLDDLVPVENRWLVLPPTLAKPAQIQTEGLAKNILVEPIARNTAPAIALAAWNLLQKDKDSIMIILSADHAISNIHGFEETIATTVELALKDHFVTIGIRPTYPATGFGYIEMGKEIHKNGYNVLSFREKPQESLAKEFLLSGKYLWNAGMFIWKTANFWKALSEIQPEITNAFETNASHPVSSFYESLPKLPIDIAFMEKTTNVACVPAMFDWNDIGSYPALRECMPLDTHGNALAGDVLSLETTGSVVHSTGPFVATLGLENMVVIATKDAVLVTPLTKSQSVKNIIEHLQKAGRTELL